MIDKIFPETLKILNNLVKFQTVSGMPNLELIEYCEKKLAQDSKRQMLFEIL